MHLLLVEDDHKIANFVIRGLKEAGFIVDHASDGVEGLDLAMSESYDALILDLMLPKMDGLAVISELRKNRRSVPVIVVSAKREVEERVRCLQSGCDDYLVKPFAFSELLARVQALLRRSGDTFGSGAKSRLIVGEIELDYVKHSVHRAGRPIELQPREFTLLEYLMRNAGRAVSKTLILENIWGYHFDPQTNVVDVLVCRLRSKLDRDFSTPMLHTIRGVGYVLKTLP